MSNPYICQHDQLKRQCPLCDAEAENAALKQEIEQLKEWIATVVNSYHHVMTYGLTQEGVALVNGPKGSDATETAQAEEGSD